MIKKVVAIAALAALTVNTAAQNIAARSSEAVQSPWTLVNLSSLQFSQASFDNWSGGGENSMAWQARFKLSADYVNGKHGWENKLDLGYGRSQVGEIEARKSLDEIRAETRYTYKTWTTLSPFVSVRFESQFDEGFDYSRPTPLRISKFMDPGYFTESAGIGWIPNKTFKTYLGASAKHTLTKNHAIPYADDPDTPNKVEVTRNEVGVSSITELNWKITQKSLFASTLDLFSNLQGGDQIDVRWKNLWSFKLNSLFSTNLEMELYYDKDISTRRQIRQALTLGLAYSFL